MEDLERRSLLAADAGLVIGDCNFDGAFNSSDVVQAFQAGKFETGEVADWSEGDWNADGTFGTLDLVAAFQAGSFDSGAAAADSATDGTTTDDGTTTGDTTGDGTADDGTTDGTPDDTTDDTTTDPCPDDMIGHHGHGGHDDLGQAIGTRGGARVQKIIDDLTKTIADNGDLPGNLTTAEAQKIVDGLTTALAAKDTTAIKDLLAQLRHERQEDHVQARIDSLKEALTSGKLPSGLTAEQVQTAIDGLTAALAANDLTAAAKILKDLHQSAADQHHEEALAHRIQAQIDHLQEAITSGKLPDGLTAENAQKLLDALKAAKESGDLTAVNNLRFTFHVESLITKINTAIKDGTTLPFGLTTEAAQTLATGLQAALTANDLDAAKALLEGLRDDHVGGPHGDGPHGGGPRGGGHGHGHHGRPANDDDDDTTADPTTDNGGADTGNEAGNVPAAVMRAIAARMHGGRRR